MSSIDDPAKLKVVELRAELSARGLDNKGIKAVLVKRLKEALEEETGNDIEDTSIADTSTEDLNVSQRSERSSSPIPQRDPSPDPVSINSSPESVDIADEYLVTAAPDDDDSSDMDKMEVEDSVKAEPIKVAAPPPPPVITATPQESAKIPDTCKKVTEQMESEDATSEAQEDAAVSISDENGDADDSSKADTAEPRNRKSRWGSVQDAPEVAEAQGEDDAEQKSSETTEARGEKRRRSTSRSPDRSAKHKSKSPIREDEPEIDAEKVQLNWVDSDLHLQIDKENLLSAKPFHEGAFGHMWAGARASHGVKTGKVYFEVKITEECKWEDAPKPEQPKAPAAKKEQPKEKQTPPTVDAVIKTEENGSPVAVKKEQDEPAKEDEAEKTAVKVVEEKTEEETKVKTEAKEEEKTEVKTEVMEEEDEEKAEEKTEEVPVVVTPKPLTHLLRVGWSTTCSDLQLGECKHSYGYESTGQTIADSTFNCYGEKFGVGDVVGAYLDLTSDPATIRYTLNGAELPEAFTMSHSDFPEDGPALFPHVLSRNYAFEVNFGSRDEPLAAQPKTLDSYTFVSEAEDRIAGPVRSTERSTCEVIMMFGLPSAGKTHWVNKHVEEHPDKRYTTLGTGQLIERMTVNGKPLKESYEGKWTVLLDKCGRCVNKLQDLAGLRRRNYILDQTNVFSSAQRRKLRPFEGFHRRAVVVVVADEEQATRERAHQEADGKDVPDSAVLEMKANMSLPTTGECLDEITWAGLNEEEAKVIVQKYNQQGRDAGFGQHQRRNSRDNRSQWHNRNNRRNDYRDNRDNRNNRWSGGGSSQRQGGGWNNHRSGGPRRDNRGGGGGGGGGPRDWRNNGGGGNQRQIGYNNRNQSGGYNRGQRNPVHRNQGGNWSQGGGGGGNWGSQGNWGGGQAWGSQGSWQGSSNWQGSGQSGGQQQWKGYGSQQGYQGYAQGYQNYPNWNYYGQYTQNWNAQETRKNQGI